MTTAQLKKIARGFANVREAVAEDIDIAVHSHNQYDTPSAIAVSRATEAIHPLFFEDPLSSVEFCEGWMAIKRATRTPILTGEKLELVKQFSPFVDSQAVDIIHPDISYAGGITGCRKIADYAALNRTPVALHNIGSLVRTYASVRIRLVHFSFFSSIKSSLKMVPHVATHTTAPSSSFAPLCPMLLVLRSLISVERAT